MFKKYIKDIVETEVIRLCDDFDKSNVLVSQLNDAIHQQNTELSKLYNTISSLKQENEQLKKEKEILERSYNFINNNTVPDLESRVITKERIATEINLMLNKEKRKAEELKEENKQLKNLSCTIVVDNNGKLDSLFNQKLKSENEKLKQELLDSKNGLNGANHVIKNNKEWIKSQDKKIKELEEEIRLFKSDKEDLQYNLRKKSTQKIQLESKNKSLEEKLLKISNVISLRSNISLYGLMSTIDTIRNILKES